MGKAFLLSSSGYKDSGYLVHSKEWIKKFFSNTWDEEVLFIPFAGIKLNYDEYEKKVQNALGNSKVISIHKYSNMKDAVKNAKSILVGGGNTFMLVHLLYKYDLIESMKQSYNDGMFYCGWSAGANIAGKTMMTTNDMPIVMPKSFDTLNIFKSQINPHFISGKISGHNGESREDRIQEYLIANKNEDVYAMPEGSALLVNSDVVEVLGHGEVLKFSYDRENIAYEVGSKIKF